MVNAIKGVLITCDPAMRTFLLSLHKTRPLILRHLDNTHLFVDPKMIQFINFQTEKLHKENHFVKIDETLERNRKDDDKKK